MYEIFERLLDQKGVTPYRVYKETGVSQSTLSDWKRGRSTPKSENLKKIADYFNVSVDYLLTGEDQKEKAPAKAEALSVDERVDQILAGMESKQTLMLDGKPMSQEATEALRSALKMGVEYARKINDEKR